MFDSCIGWIWYGGDGEWQVPWSVIASLVYASFASGFFRHGGGVNGASSAESIRDRRRVSRCDVLLRVSGPIGVLLVSESRCLSIAHDSGPPEQASGHLLVHDADARPPRAQAV